MNSPTRLGESTEWDFGGRFNFEIEYDDPSEYGSSDRAAGWHVRLPHQCDSWDIAGEYFGLVPYMAALQALDVFIEEATAARDWLRSQPPSPPSDTDSNETQGGK